MRIYLLLISFLICLSARADLIGGKRVNIKSLFPRGTNGYVLTTIDNGTGIGWDSVNAMTINGLDASQFLRSDTNDTFTGSTLTLNGNGAFAQSAYFTALTDTTTTAITTIDWRNGNKQSLDLTMNSTLLFTDPAGPTSLALVINVANGGNHIVTWNGNILFPTNGTELTVSTTNGFIDVVSCLYTGTAGQYLCQGGTDFE